MIKDENGQVVELHCTYDPETKSGSGFSGRKVKGTIHWVSATEGINCQVRLYEPLFKQQPDEEHLLESVNPNSLVEINNAVIEPSVLDFFDAGVTHYQFLRNGYYVIDHRLASQEGLVFNRIVPLRSSYKL